MISTSKDTSLSIAHLRKTKPTKLKIITNQPQSSSLSSHPIIQAVQSNHLNITKVKRNQDISEPLHSQPRSRWSRLTSVTQGYIENSRTTILLTSQLVMATNSSQWIDLKHLRVTFKTTKRINGGSINPKLSRWLLEMLSQTLRLPNRSSQHMKDSINNLEENRTRLKLTRCSSSLGKTPLRCNLIPMGCPINSEGQYITVVMTCQCHSIKPP
jgi:hypothetical protein